MKKVILIFIMVFGFFSALSYADDNSPSVNNKIQNLFSFDADSFAVKMGIKPLPTDGSAPQFWRKIQDSKLEKAEADFASLHYSCKDKLQVTLIPMIHIADKSFYERVDQIALQADVLLFEGLRQNYFFGPPYESDPRIQTAEDYKILARLRLRTITEAITTFRKTTNRNPGSFAEMSAVLGGESLEYSQKLGKWTELDPWGHLFQLFLQPDGSIKITSLGPDGIVSSDDITVEIPAVASPESVGLATIGGIDAYNKMGQDAGLELQAHYAMQSYLKESSIDADVSINMVFGDAQKVEKIAANNFRNVLPIIWIDQFVSNKKNSQKNFAIMYGALHMLKFHQYLTGDYFGCTLKSTDWIPAVSVDKSQEHISPEQLSVRMSTIKDLSNVAPTLNPDPLGVGK